MLINGHTFTHKKNLGLGLGPYPIPKPKIVFNTQKLCKIGSIPILIHKTNTQMFLCIGYGYDTPKMSIPNPIPIPQKNLDMGMILKKMSIRYWVWI